jgi:hypothetical protein
MLRDGIVQLWGTITDDRERQATIVAAAQNCELFVLSSSQRAGCSHRARRVERLRALPFSRESIGRQEPRRELQAPSSPMREAKQ